MALSQTVDRARVEKCLGSASDIGSQENIELLDIDDWKLRLLVDVLDNLSAIADDDYYCKHLRRWQEICKAQYGQPGQKQPVWAEGEENPKRRCSC